VGLFRRAAALSALPAVFLLADCAPSADPLPGIRAPRTKASPAHQEAAIAAGRDFEIVVRTYEESLEGLRAQRLALGRRWNNALDAATKAEVLTDARASLQRAVIDEMFPAWLGTDWAFYGTSEKPGEGTIACGYFVSTVLRDSGFKVARVGLAQQASSKIVRTFATKIETEWFRNRPPLEVVKHVKGLGEGLYIVGLDHHVGFLVYDGDAVEMCHSSVLWPGTVVCEPAATAEAMQSTVHVVGPVLTDRVLRRWVQGRAFATYSG
jgi:hypothetical protein